MDAQLIAALDVGTSRVKGALFAWPGPAKAGGAGRALILATASAPLPPVRFDGLLAEQDPPGLLAALSQVLEGLAAASPAGAWGALALATQRGTLVPVSAGGEPVAPLVSWLDRRAAGSGGDRWDWYLRAQPKVAAGTARVLTLMSWLTLGLTGEALDTAQTQAPESGRRGDAARLVPPGHVAGPATGSLAAVLGLPRSLPVVVAGGDKNGELVGSGCVAPGPGVVSFGTAVSLGTLVFGQLAPPGVFATPSHVPRLTQLEVGLPFGGGVWAWLEGLFGAATHGLGDAALTDESPLFVPYLAGSLSSPAATGSWHGLTPDVSARSLAASGLEGIVMDLRLGLGRLPAPLTDVTLTGGGTQSPVLAAWLADALGCPVRAVPSGDTGLAGAGMAAAVGLGWAEDWRTAAAALAPHPWPPHHPRPARAARWERRFARWRALVDHG